VRAAVAVENASADKIKEAVKELANAVTKMGDSIYQAKAAAGKDASSSADKPADTPSDSSNDKDAEFKDRK